MKRQLAIAAVLATALALPAVASAKGPSSASITGPNLDRVLTIRGGGEGGPGTPLGRLVDLGGFFAQMYGQTPDPTLAARPAGTLGPRYKVVYVVPGPNGIESRVVQLAYPFAKPAPLTYMKPGQVYWGVRHAHGGWYSAPGLRSVFVVAGVTR
jgi:hypothetical protein